MKTFYFNTGVRPYSFSPPAFIGKGDVISPNGVRLIPFDCEDVPKESVFQFASDYTEAGEGLLCREICNSTLLSKYAFFTKPIL